MSSCLNHSGLISNTWSSLCSFLIDGISMLTVSWALLDMFSVLGSFLLPSSLSLLLILFSSFSAVEPGSSKASPWAKMCQTFLSVIPSSLCFSPAAHAVASKGSREITATGRLQPRITNCWDGPAPQQGTETLALALASLLALVSVALPSLLFVLSLLSRSVFVCLSHNKMELTRADCGREREAERS